MRSRRGPQGEPARYAVNDSVKCFDGTWGKIVEVHPKVLIVRVRGLDEEWDLDVVEKVVR